MFFPPEILEKLKSMTVDEQREYLRLNTFMSASTSKYLGVSRQSLMRWHTAGKLVPDLVLDDGYRFYFRWSLDKFLKERKEAKIRDMRRVNKKSEDL